MSILSLLPPGGNAFPRLSVLGGRLRARQAAVNDRQQFGRLERLLQARHRTQPRRHVQEVRRVFRGKAELLSGYHDHRHLRPRLMHLPHRLKAVHPRHEDVADEKIEALLFDEMQARATIVDGFDRMFCALKQNLDRRKDSLVVIDDENARHGLPLQDFARSTEGYINFESGQGP